MKSSRGSLPHFLSFQTEVISLDFSNSFTLTALVLLLLSLLSVEFFASKLSRSRRKIKYHPVAGTSVNQLLNFHRLHDFMTDLASKYRTYRLLKPFRNEVYTSEPDNVEYYMLKTNFENFGKGNYNHSLLNDLLGDGIFTVDGDKWRQQRKLSSYEFSTKILRDFSSVVFRKNAARIAQIVSQAAALTETLRLYPAVPVDGKVCSSDDTLTDGFSVRKGDMIVYQPYAMGRMKFIWGDDAEEYRPERWLEENGMFRSENPFKFTALSFPGQDHVFVWVKSLLTGR